MARKITINSMTLNGMRIDVDVTQLNRMMKDIEKDVAYAMRKGISLAMSQVKRKAQDKLYSQSGHIPQAKKVGHSLDFDYDVYTRGDEVTADARFGSKGPDAHGSLDYVGPDGNTGARTSSDDTGGTYPIAWALEYGNPKGAHWFAWKGASGKRTAHIRGRQVGSAGGSSAWLPAQGGKSWTYGFTALGYINSAQDDFKSRISGYVQKQLSKRFS